MVHLEKTAPVKTAPAKKLKPSQLPDDTPENEEPVTETLPYTGGPVSPPVVPATLSTALIADALPASIKEEPAPAKAALAQAVAIPNPAPELQPKTALSDISPTAEPISWSLVAATLVDIAIAKGFHPDSLEKQLILYCLPYILAGLWSRFQVYAPDTVAWMKALIIHETQKDATSGDTTGGAV